MSKTEIAELTLQAARTVLAERDAGRSVDPSRLEWAEQIVKGNAPTPKTEVSDSSTA